ncbi:MAG: hypothetical protein U0900_01515 [Myxococcota bacterium]
MSLPECLERAASELTALADRIRPANGDPHRLLELLAPADATRVLGFVLAHDEASGEELLDAWGELESAAGVLAAVPEASLPKAGRKQLRRALHRLRARGVAIAEPAPAATAASGAKATPARVGAALNDRWQEAHLSAPDFRGTRMGYLVDDHPAGGARLFEIRFDPARGILDFKLYNAGRSKVRGFLKSLAEGANQRLFEVDRAALCALVRRASQAQPSDRALPTFFVEWRSRLFSDALDGEATPGELARRALGEAGDPDKSLESVGDSIRSGRMGPWPPSTTWVGERMERAQQAMAGLAGEAREAAIGRWVDEVTGELDGETSPEGLAQQLAEWAWIEWQREDADRARALLAVATGVTGAKGAEIRRSLARARVDALFGPFLAALRMESDPK